MMRASVTSCAVISGFIAHWPDVPVPRDEGEPHVTSLANRAAALFRMSRSAFSCATSLRSRVAPASSGCGRRRAADGPTDRVPICAARSRGGLGHEQPGPPQRPRSLINLTASNLNSRLNFLLCIPTLQFRQTPYLGVHETGSRPDLTDLSNALSRPRVLCIRRRTAVVGRSITIA